MKVLFLTTIPSPYRVSFFNELGKLVDLTVLFEKGSSDERDKTWKAYSFDSFTGYIMKGKPVTVRTAFCPGVLRYLRHKWDRIIVSDLSTPTGMLAIQYLKMNRIPYWIEGDGGFAKSGKGIKEKIKKHFVKGARGYFSTSKEHDKYYIQYGADINRIFRYPFTSIVASDIINHPQSIEEQSAVREELSITEKKVILTVGRFIQLKGFDIVLNASKSFSDEYGFYFVGGEPTEEYIELAKGANNIHFIGFKQKEELKKYYLAADLFVFPTRGDVWGLVINEAMSCGLPVITTNKCIAGLELVENGENGYIIPVDSPEAMIEKINKCFDSDISRLGNNSLKIISNYTIEEMAKRHLEVLSN